MEAKQWQELCELAEFYQEGTLKCGYHYEFKEKVINWFEPDGSQCKNGPYWGPLPTQDTNILFKWMAPKFERIKLESCLGGYHGWAWYKGRLSKYTDRDPCEALAQAMYKAGKGEITEPHYEYQEDTPQHG